MKLKLSDITLFSLIGSEEYFEKTITATLHCMNQCDFDVVKIASCVPFKIDNIECIPIKKLTKIDYCHFFLYELHKIVNTDFCLTIQSDGFIINPSMWSNEFMDYDYIGAPWLDFNQKNCIGNGGFSLRSKKFLHQASKLTYNPNIQFQKHISAGQLVTPEDWFCCVYEYDTMKNNGINFPKIDVAYSFSVEHPSFFKPYNRYDINTYQSFGFHGEFNRAALKLIGG